MNAVPSAFNGQLAEHRFVKKVCKERIVGRASHLEAAHPDVAASGKNYGVRTAHVLLAERVAHIAAVNAARTFNAGPCASDAKDHGFRPLRVCGTVVVDRSLSALITRQVQGCLQRRVVV